ncbi:alpha/beta hydrolase fold domain-containing protein [Niveibacterium sp. 24ML]|uniref:alpha/beta hydrolase fold domain-containing protein n=1 Tax=Niveibacterium sp. 24ML TaxID=2985512 RepID=UPI0022705374|nr:alpha/beta hydrolase fold domain-containing protein [Niveibacterium sp. 24ML]MCX9156320.1 alpha/beta hydrolase fold domain-containing protein [Niveibacterium sp. 24ML]
MTLNQALAALLAATLTACGGGGDASTTPEAPPGPPQPPASGLYVSPQFDTAQMALYLDVPYSTRPNEGGVQYSSSLTKNLEIGGAELTLELDVAVPPNATASTPQPAIVWIHGGGFVAGSKEERRDDAMSYARAGYVAATINYRLTPDNQANPAIRVRAIQQATEDAMNAIRYLRANAARYHIDPNRIATIGTSAGGGISLINAIEADTLLNTVSDFPGVSARVQAAIATGATLGESGIDTNSLFHFDAGDSPVLLFHAKETDSVTGATWSGNVLPTQKAIVDAGGSCTVVAQGDMTHTVDLSLGGRWWTQLKPFLWEKLRLAAM